MSLFIEFMGDSPTIKVIDYLLTERDMDFSISDIARNSNISRATLYRIWNNLIKYEIVLQTRQIGLSKLFKLNKSNPKIRRLIEIDDMLIKEDLKKRIKLKATH